MKLPTEPSIYFKPVEQLFIILYGAPKIGKTEFAGLFGQGKTLYIATEAGQDFIEGYKHPVKNWKEFEETVSALASHKGDLPYKAVAVDTIDNLFKWCAEGVIASYNQRPNVKQAIEHESDLAMGKGYNLVNREWFSGISQLLNVCRQRKMGAVFISHSRTVVDPSNQSETIKAGISDTSFKVVSGACDMILYMTTVAGEKPGTSERAFYTKSTSKVEAGDRTGSLPSVLKLGNSGKMGWDTFKAAYDKAIEDKKAAHSQKG